MSRVARSSLFMVAATIASTSLMAKAQEPMGTYPATPLASKHFPYPTGIVSPTPSFWSF